MEGLSFELIETMSRRTEKRKKLSLPFSFYWPGFVRSFCFKSYPFFLRFVMLMTMTLLAFHGAFFFFFFDLSYARFSDDTLL